MIKYIKALIAIVLSFLAGACDDSPEFQEVYFVGDSLIARWDLQESFPGIITKNYGQSGAGISYIESLAHKFADKEVVVLIGTNNIGSITQDNMDSYMNRYISALTQLDAKRLILLSIPPRRFKNDPPNITEIKIFIPKNYPTNIFVFMPATTIASYPHYPTMLRDITEWLGTTTTAMAALQPH